MTKDWLDEEIEKIILTSHASIESLNSLLELRGNYDLDDDGFCRLFYATSIIVDQLESYVSKTKPIAMPGPVDASAAIGYLREVTEFVQFESSANLFERYTARVKNLLADSYAIEFTEGDIKQIQDLVDELRGMIADSSMFEDDHRRRLLMRLEKLQSEMHKRMSDIDVFYGLFVDGGVALGKFGKEAAPMVDLIKKITRIGWRAQTRAEELPSDATLEMLEQDDDIDAG